MVLARLANAEILPYDEAALAERLAGLSADLAKSGAARQTGLTLDSLNAAIATLRASGAAFSALALARLSPARLAKVNGLLLGVEQEMVRPTGLVGRPRMRNLVIASDRDNGYSDMPFPGIGEALRDKDAARAQREAAELAMHIRAAAARVDHATAALR